MDSSPIEQVVSLRESQAVYAITFSPDGRFLVWGGGSSEGKGFLRWCGLESPGPGELDLTEPSEPDWKMTVDLAHKLGLRGITGPDLLAGNALSGLAFDQSGQHLALTLWSLGHRNFPTLVSEIEGSTLQLQTICASAEGDELDPYQRRKRFSNGAVMLEDTLVVHRWASANHCLEFHPLPFRAGFYPHHRNSSRIAPLGKGWFATGGDAGLVLRHQTGTIRWIKGTDVSAICCEPLGGAFVTGDPRGGLARWRFQIDKEELQRERDFLCPSGYQIEALGYLRGGLLLAGCRGGSVTLWQAGELLALLRLPGFSARTLACHPHLPCLAVGGKGPAGEGQMHLLWVW